MGKLWLTTIFNGKITMFNGKTMENHHFLMGKLWKTTIFNGKTMENHNF